jgi:hypothetical protein
MRKGLISLPLVALVAACSGGGPQTLGSVAAPAAPTGAGNAGAGSGVTAGTGAGGAAVTAASFLAIGAEKSFDAIGAAHSLKEDPKGGVLYQGNASTVRNPTGQISYNPRDGIFTVTMTDSKADLSENLRFQDPAHRTDFKPHLTPQWGVPNLEGFNYLESIGTTVDDVSTFFYQRPGVSTTYVTLAGFVRNDTPASGTATFKRGVFAFGDQTVRGQIPSSGTGTYTGGFIATMINNPTLDGPDQKASYLQWLQGSSTTTVDFGKSTVNLQLNGTVNQANMSGYQASNADLSIPTGATFTATATGGINLVANGGFTGKFDAASFAYTPSGATGPVTKNVDFASISAGSSTAGASSVDGTFFGPDAANVGGSFRIVGGIPDQRVDILGAFAGARK